MGTHSARKKAWCITHDVVGTLGNGSDQLLALISDGRGNKTVLPQCLASRALEPTFGLAALGNLAVLGDPVREVDQASDAGLIARDEVKRGRLAAVGLDEGHFRRRYLEVDNFPLRGHFGEREVVVVC